jgi:hypothetical protein
LHHRAITAGAPSMGTPCALLTTGPRPPQAATGMPSLLSKDAGATRCANVGTGIAELPGPDEARAAPLIHPRREFTPRSRHIHAISAFAWHPDN